MPNRKQHEQIAAVAGVSVGLLQHYRRWERLGEDGRDPFHDLVQFASTVYISSKAGRIPDILEPAISPRHRQSAHSVTAGGSLASLLPKVDDWEDHWRDLAKECRRRAESASERGDVLTVLLYRLGEVACCFVAALPAGIIAGYCSHLLADARTPAGIPII